MKENVLLTSASLFSILLMTLHLTSDTVHARVGTGEAGGSTLVAVPVLVLLLYGTLVLFSTAPIAGNDGRCLPRSALASTRPQRVRCDHPGQRRGIVLVDRCNLVHCL